MELPEWEGCNFDLARALTDNASRDLANANVSSSSKDEDANANANMSLQGFSLQGFSSS